MCASRILGVCGVVWRHAPDLHGVVEACRLKSIVIPLQASPAKKAKVAVGETAAGSSVAAGGADGGPETTEVCLPLTPHSQPYSEQGLQ